MLPERALEDIHRTLASHPRAFGYYLVKMVALEPGWRADEQAALTRAIEALDDRPWPAPELRPSDQSWTDYETTEAVGEQNAIQALVGGNAVGHARETIERPEARRIWLQFRALFSAEARFFCGVGLGDSRYVFSEGVVVIDEWRAGCLCVVEND